MVLMLTDLYTVRFRLSDSIFVITVFKTYFDCMMGLTHGTGDSGHEPALSPFT